MAKSFLIFNKKKWAFILYNCLFFSMFGQTYPDFSQLFQQQITETCKQSFLYEKSLHNLRQQRIKPETQTLQVNKADFLKNELIYTFEFDASAAKKKADFIQIQKQDTLIFTPKAAVNTELKKQKILYQKQKIRFVESLIIKEYWLYTMEMHIRVYFDEKGIYKHHFLRMYSKIKGLEPFDNYILAEKKN